MPAVPEVTGADNVVDERADEVEDEMAEVEDEPVVLDVSTVVLVWVETMVDDDDVDITVAARIGDPVLEDVFLLANTPPTPPPTAPPMTKTTIMQRSQKVIGRKPQTRRELECEVP